MTKGLDKRLLLLDQKDNIVVTRQALHDGTPIKLEHTKLNLQGDAPVGFKIARHDLKANETVIKYGAPIGITTQVVAAGEVLHLHNMKSDYLPTYTPEGDSFTSRGGPT